MEKSFKMPQSKAPSELGSDETPYQQVASNRLCLPSSSFSSFWRHYLRQEPYEVIPHVRICAGGAG